MPGTTKNARMIIDNIADNAALSLSVGSEIVTMPLSHLQTYNNSRVFRTNDKDIEITVTLEQSDWFSALALWRNNLTGTATVAISAFDNQGNELLNTGDLPAFETKTLLEMNWGIDPLAVSVFTGWKLTYSVFWLPLKVAKTIKIRIKDADNARAIEIARLYIGRAIETTYNFAHGNTITWVDKSKDFDTAGGSSYSIESDTWREAQLEFSNIVEIDRPHLSEAFRKVGTQNDWFISMKPESGGQLERDYSFATKCKKAVKIKDKNSRFYQAKLSIREV